MTTSTERIAYKVREVAAMLGVSKRRVYELVKSNQLPSFRLGGDGDTLIPASGIEAAIKKWSGK